MPASSAGHRRKRTVPRPAHLRLVLLAGVLVISGCSNAIAGIATSDPMAVASDKPVSYTPSDFPIEFAQDDGVDQIARDALEDINTYWTEFYPEVYGEDFDPLQGRYYSIEPGEGNASECMDGPDDEVIVNNAFYCSYADEVVYWRPLLERFASEYSDLQVGLVLAHELGHAIQARNSPPSERSIVHETQADCFAGTWARQVADGNAAHFTFNEANLDLTLQAWAFELPDQVGTDPERRGAHGSAFDRVSAFQEGYEDGPTACRDNFNDDRIFTSAVFTEEGDDSNVGDDGRGNVDYDSALRVGQTAFDEFYTAKFEELGVEFKVPALVLGAGDTPACQDDHTVYYCPADNSIVIANDEKFRDLHLNFGDYAVITTLGLAFGQAALLQLEYSMDDVRAIGAISCLTGTFSGEVLEGENGAYGLELSPGDFDEATVLLLSAKSGNSLVETGDITAFDRMDQFRFGVTAAAGGSISSCGLNAPS